MFAEREADSKSDDSDSQPVQPSGSVVLNCASGEPMAVDRRRHFD